MPSERERLEARLKELRPLNDEFEFLQTLIYLIEEGFVEIEDGRLYPAGGSVELLTLSA